MNTLRNNAKLKMTALITGAAGGLGKAFSVECASRGWDLFLTDRQIEPLEILAKGLQNTYDINIITHPCDLTDPLARTQFFKFIQSEGTRFTMLINVAGVDFEGPFLDQDITRIENIIHLNIEASVAMMHQILHFRQPGARFRIINVASLAAFYPMPVKATYAASKRFLLDFSLALREELAQEEVSVTVLCPAGMPTTQGTVRAIDAQGLAGFLTTVDVGRVVDQCLNAAMAGKAVVIPGWLNFMLQTISSLLPPTILARLIYNRWTSVRSSRIRSIVEPEKTYVPLPSR